jgi:hypothetical protein
MELICGAVDIGIPIEKKLYHSIGGYGYEYRGEINENGPF